MRVPKRLLASEPVRRVLAAAAAGYMRIVHATSRWEVRGGDIPARFWDSGDPFIMGLWHGRLLMLFYCWRRGMPVRTLISHHRDGELLAQTMQRFGIGALRGSSSVDGAGALRDIVRTLKSGTSVCLAPDGPRGPRMRASAGVVAAARLSGVPVIPIAVGVTRRRLLASWDRFLLPLPFSRGVFVWGEPILVPRDADAAASARAQAQIEAAITDVTDAADRLTGHEPVEPEPPLEPGPALASPAGREP